LPADEAQVVETIRLATRNRWRILPAGLGSKLGWSAAPARVDLVLSTRRLAGIVAYEPGDGTLTARAGTTMEALERATLESRNHLTPRVPAPSRATIGGVLAAGQSGVDRLRYGPARHHVLGMRAALADGSSTKSGGKLVKNVTGYDLHRLYCGSAGSLCVVLEVTLRLFAGFERERLLTIPADDRANALSIAASVDALRSIPCASAARTSSTRRARGASTWSSRGATAVVDAARRTLLGARGDAVEGLESIERLRDAELAPGLWPDSRFAGRRSRLGAALAPLPADARMVVDPAIACASLWGPTVAGAELLGRRDVLPRTARSPERSRCASSGASIRGPLRGRDLAGETLIHGPEGPRRLRREPRLHPLRSVRQLVPDVEDHGVESSSPRGRVHLMRAVAEGELAPDADYVEEMEFCLLCRHCESVCPSGVRFGAMMETARDAITRKVGRPLSSRLVRWLGFRVLLPRQRCSARPRRSSASHRRSASGRRALRACLPPTSAGRSLRGRRRWDARAGTASVLEGCVMPLLYGRVNRATVAVLARAGFDVLAPRGQGCCGSLHAHNGDLEGARILARRTIAAFEVDDGPIVVNSAGCSAHMKDYGHLLADDPGQLADHRAWRARAERFASRVADLSEFLVGKLEPSRTVGGGPIAYDDPCHLCHAQRIRSQPRKLLDAVPGLARVEMRDSEACCGSAGIYSVARPAASAAILDPKIAAFLETGAKTLVTANPGCQMQWEAGFARAGVPARVAHLAEILEEASRS
jgi:glycolate oxidase iron-sulfur subunit